MATCEYSYKISYEVQVNQLCVSIISQRFTLSNDGWSIIRNKHSNPHFFSLCGISIGCSRYQNFIYFLSNQRSITKCISVYGSDLLFKVDCNKFCSDPPKDKNASVIASTNLKTNFLKKGSSTFLQPRVTSLRLILMYRKTSFLHTFK